MTNTDRYKLQLQNNLAEELISSLKRFKKSRTGREEKIALVFQHTIELARIVSSIGVAPLASRSTRKKLAGSAAHLPAVHASLSSEPSIRTSVPVDRGEVKYPVVKMEARGLTREEQDTLVRLSEPLISWLCASTHPMVKLIIEWDSIELLESQFYTPIPYHEANSPTQGS